MKKIKLFNEKSKKYWIGAGIVGAIALPVSLITVSLTVNKRNFVLANYQSYMSPSVKESLKQQYGVAYDSFENVEGAKKLVTGNDADIINTTSYEVVNWAKQGLIQKLDWSRFGISGVTDATSALSLFTPTVQAILKAYDLNGNGTTGEPEDNLLNYGVPYFLQDLVFAYRGSEIPSLSGNNLTWAQVLDAIVKEPRFHTKDNKPQLIALDDARTMYSIPRAIQDGTGNINPQPGASINTLSDTYNFLKNPLNQLGSLPIKFNSDSTTVLNSVAYETVQGGFMFNGDAIYAAQGGDNSVDIPDGSFHIVRPTDNVVALDLMVFNKNTSSNWLAKSYDLISELCLKFDPSNHPEDSAVFKNFDSVNYTTPLQSLYNYLIKPDGYFSGDDLLLNAFKVEPTDVTKKVEQPIDDLVKSNFSFAWLKFKTNLN